MNPDDGILAAVAAAVGAEFGAPETPPAPPAPPAAAAADPAEIADICMKADAPALIAPLIREKATKEQATARANAVGQIRQMVADAGKVSKAVEAKMADEMIAQGLSVEKARETLFAKLVAAQSPEIDPQSPPAGQAKKSTLLADEMKRRHGIAA